MTVGDGNGDGRGGDGGENGRYSLHVLDEVATVCVNCDDFAVVEMSEPKRETETDVTNAGRTSLLYT